MEVSSGIEFTPEVIAAALSNIYRRKFDIDRELEAHLYTATADIFREAVGRGMAAAVERGTPLPDEAFREALLHNVDVFSAFRVHRMQKDIAAMMLDGSGKLKPFSLFARDVQPYVSHQNRAWLRTEYDTAVRRAQLASEWRQFEAEKDVLPNLRWEESVSIHPGADHRVFWGTVRPIDDPFWSKHRPGDRWNCKCGLEATDEPPTDTPDSSSPADNPAPGLESNPGKDGALFSDRHPYFPKGCSVCPYARNRLYALFADLADRKDCMECRALLDIISGRKQRMSEYDRNKWEYTYIPKVGKGFVVTQKERIAEAKVNKQEQKKFEKELRMCMVIADNGHEVEFLHGVGRSAGQTYDITMDGIKADLKSINGGAGNIVKYAKKALSEQGGEAVVFELPNAESKYFEYLAEARRKISGRMFFYIKGEYILKEVK